VADVAANDDPDVRVAQSDAPIVAKTIPAAEARNLLRRPAPAPASKTSQRRNEDEAPILAAKALLHILVAGERMGAPAKLHTSQNIAQHLQALGYPVTVTARAQWQNIFADSNPEIILLDPGHNTPQARELCAHLKEESDGTLVIVVLPLSGNGALSPDGLWASWSAAGADMLLDANISSIELESQLDLWTRHVRVTREMNSMRETLGKQVQTDELTQLLNRRFFFQAAHREVSRSRRYNHALSCLMIDVNYFKLYNKTYGYSCGDYILRSIATTIRAWTRESDINARFGAKKFVLLLPETDIEGAMMLREKLLREVADFGFVWQGQRLPVTISIGEAERRRDFHGEPGIGSTRHTAEEDEDDMPVSVREELADLLEDADAALYVAKKGVRYPDIQPPVSSSDGREVVGILGSS
jgi:diguanylate cyclase (GGDEF)-like protein